MTKIKERAIIPSLREKRRYLAYHVISQQKMNGIDVKNAILESCNSFLGELECAKAGVMIMANGNNGVVRMNNKYLSKVRAAIMLISNIENERVIIMTLGVSGILNKARSLFGKSLHQKELSYKESSQRRDSLMVS